MGWGEGRTGEEGYRAKRRKNTGRRTQVRREIWEFESGGPGKEDACEERREKARVPPALPIPLFSCLSWFPSTVPIPLFSCLSWFPSTVPIILFSPLSWFPSTVPIILFSLRS